MKQSILRNMVGLLSSIRGSYDRIADKSLMDDDRRESYDHTLPYC